MKVNLMTLLLSLLLAAGTAIADDDLIFFFQGDRLEYQDKSEEWLWDLQGWVGGDEKKFWWKSEGELHDGDVLDAELQLLYSTALTPFFDLQFGLRHDFRPEPSRTHAVIGLQGLAPQWFEIDAAAFLSDSGDLSVRFEAEYDMRLSQKLILQPRIEINLGISEDSELGLGSGIRTSDLGLRLRYQFRREFAPYLGLSWRKTYGDTRDALSIAGEDDDFVTLVAGARFWF